MMQSSQTALSPSTVQYNGQTREQNEGHEAGTIPENILEQKYKARAMMAASGMSINAGVSQSPGPGQPALPGLPSADSKDRPLSRKRARSGSRKPLNATDQESAATAKPIADDVPVNQWVQRDLLHTAASLTDSRRSDALIEEKTSLMKDVLMPKLQHRGLQAPRIRYPQEGEGRFMSSARRVRIPRRLMNIQADQPEDLVPIRLDLEFEKLRLRDTFTMNLYERSISEQMLTDSLIEDFQIPAEGLQNMRQQVHQAIHEQLEDYHPHPMIEEEPLDPHLVYTAYKDDDIRILVKLNITIGQHSLVDQFEWDMNNPSNSPEEFAKKMARDLSLSGEFTTAISHSIREQTQLFTKSLYISHHAFDGRPVEDADIRDNLQPSPLHSVFRPQSTAKEYAPYFYELSDADLERTELAFSREQRQQKRSVNRRGGPTLPDLRERQKTWRTQVTSTVIPGSAEAVEESGLYKLTRSSTGRSRRLWKGDRGDESELSEEDESDPDSPARNTLQGTSRTRGMRGAASAAQAAMRAGYARSQTPEMNLHHHETRTTAKKISAYEREDSAAESDKFLIRLKLPRQRYRDWWRNYKAQMKEKQAREQQQAQARAQLAASFTGSQNSSAQGTPNPRHMPPPMSTPSSSQRQQVPGQLSGTPYQRPPSSDPNQRMPQQQRYGQIDGHASTPTPPNAARQLSQPPMPPPPQWLANALSALSKDYPRDHFEPAMRWNPNEQVYQPRIRCLDCSGMLYNTDTSNPVENFKVHLRNSNHVEKRNERLAKGNI